MSSRTDIPFHGSLWMDKTLSPVPMDRVKIGELGVALCHDLFDPMPSEYDDIKSYWIEPPYPNGFKVFNDRVKEFTDGRDWKGLISRLSGIIRRGKPVHMVVGYRALGLLPDTDCTPKEIQLHNTTKVWYGTWNDEGLRASNNIEAARELSKRYMSIGDPCCGYGLTGREACKVGARFVLSDYDPLCIGQIAEEAKKWAL